MIDHRTVLGLIPARGGSKGVPGKNIRGLCGRPLLAYTVEAARGARYFDDLIVSTDSPEISEVARSLGVEVPFIRPIELATDTAKALGVIQHALRFMEDARRRTYDLVVYLEPPNPLRIPEDIDLCLELFEKHLPDSVVSVQEANQFHPILMKKVVDGLLRPIWKEEPEGVPRQLYEPTAYMRNGAVYVFRRERILAGELYGDDVVPYVMPVERSVCIDDMLDWHVAEALIKSATTAGG
jgi:CMP-N-acetylneuraminic acid synthetase